MIINAGKTDMTASYAKKTGVRRTQETLYQNAKDNRLCYSLNSFEASYEERSAAKKSLNYDRNQKEEKQEALPSQEEALSMPLPCENYDRLKASGAGARERVKTPTVEDRINSAMDFMERLRMYMMSIRERIFGRRGLFREYPGLFSGGQGTVFDLSSGRGAVSVWHKKEYTSCEYYEEESVTFSTTGQVTTADGRSIEFDLEMNLSRSFMQKAECMTEGVEVVMTDPIVISMDGFPAGISDQKWSFDIDADGVKDNISMLSQGAGFLAYDRNGDGVINDGSELFGARTGNGFSELAMLDADGNGWIDEADAAYKLLSVWLKDDSGQDRLVSLKEANVGAIFLGNMGTAFSYNNSDTNDENARLKSSGFYLTEDGSAKAMQQIDFAKSAVVA